MNVEATEVTTITSEIAATAPTPLAERQPAPSGVAPLVQMLASGQLVAEHVERALSLQRQHDEYEAKRAFSAAMSRFRSQVTNVAKDREGHHKGTKYATLGAVAKTIAHPLAENGLSYYWTEAQDGAQITVTCHVSHELGHELSTSLSAGPDDQGAKTPIQAIASTVSYLRRYTLLGLLGLATEDDDGQSSGPVEEMLSGLEIDALAGRVSETGGDVKKWRSMVTAANPQGVPASKHAKLMAEIEAAAKKRAAKAADKPAEDAPDASA